MEQAGASRYWCHMCSQTVNPIMEIESMKCPICETGFLEETAANETPPPLDQDLPDSDRVMSIWAPILLGMMANPILHRAPEPEDDEHGPNPNDEHGDQELESLITRRRRSSAALLQLLQGIRAGMVSESDDQEQRDREGQRMILINPFNQTIIVQQQGGGSGDPSNHGPGLDVLMQHLAGTDPNRYGTPPARKEAVEALQTVKIEMEMKCAICLDECDVGAELKEMPCKHRFHSTCIVAWLELHSSCPVCRYQLPADESKLVSDDGGEDVRRLLLPLPLLWPFDILLSMNSSSLALPSVSSTDAPPAN